jgi:hypothetical protein
VLVVAFLTCLLLKSWYPLVFIGAVVEEVVGGKRYARKLGGFIDFGASCSKY